MAWVHESDRELRESQDMEYLAQIVERLFTLLPAMRDLRKVAVLKAERDLHHVQQRNKIDDHINNPLLNVSGSDEKGNVSTYTDSAACSYLVVCGMLQSLLDNFTKLWKQTQYHAEEVQSLHIAVSMMPVASTSTSTLTQYARTKAKMQSGQSYVDQKARRYSRCPSSVSEQSIHSVDPAAQIPSRSGLDPCEQKLREDRLHRKTALGAGAVGLVVARMLLTRRARFHIRV